MVYPQNNNHQWAVSPWPCWKALAVRQNRCANRNKFDQKHWQPLRRHHRSGSLKDPVTSPPLPLRWAWCFDRRNDSSRSLKQNLKLRREPAPIDWSQTFLISATPNQRHCVIGKKLQTRTSYPIWHACWLSFAIDGHFFGAILFPTTFNLSGRWLRQSRRHKLMGKIGSETGHGYSFDYPDRDPMLRKRWICYVKYDGHRIGLERLVYLILRLSNLSYAREPAGEPIWKRPTCKTGWSFHSQFNQQWFKFANLRWCQKTGLVSDLAKVPKLDKAIWIDGPDLCGRFQFGSCLKTTSVNAGFLLACKAQRMKSQWTYLLQSELPLSFHHHS